MPISHSAPDSSLYVDTQEPQLSGPPSRTRTRTPPRPPRFVGVCSGDARQAASTALSAAGGRGHHYSALIWPHESNLRVVGFSPISKPQCSPQDITFDLFFHRIQNHREKVDSQEPFPGVPIEQVNYLAGHKSMAMTKRYDHANEEGYSAAIEALDAAGKTSSAEALAAARWKRS